MGKSWLLSLSLEKQSYSRNFEDTLGNLNMDWILEDIELLLILLGVKFMQVT